MKAITAAELKNVIAEKQDILLIDVREDYEHELFNIGGSLIPMGSVMQNINKIPTDKRVVIYCEKDIRTTIIIQKLEEKFGFTNLVNLSGGMQAWKKETIQQK